MSYADIGCYGQKIIQTPHIDSIAKEGIKFNHAYAATAICGPSRCGLITGKHMGHARIREHGQPTEDGGSYQEILHEEDYTFGNVMQNLGYKTAAIGKWAVGLENTEAIPNKKGFDYSFGFYDQILAHTFYPASVWEDGKPYPLPGNIGFDMTKRYQYNWTRYDEACDCENTYDDQGNLIIEELEDSQAAQNTYDLCEEKALNFIKENKNNPFFLYLAFQNPHGPLIVPSLEPYTHSDFPSLRHKEWAAIITRMDTGVGRIMDLLKTLELEDDTIIFFASDNGYSAWGYFGLEMQEEVEFFNHKGPFRGSKFTLDGEAGIRVPFIAKWPGKIKANIETDQQIAFWDVLATFAEIGGGTPPEDTDGISFLNTLLGNEKEQAKHEYLYWELNHEQALRMGDYKIFRKHPSEEIEVYNILEDTRENNNLAQQMPELVRKAEHLFKEARTPSKIFINPGESDEEHLSRLKGYKNNSYRADDEYHLQWIKKFE